MRFFLVIPIIMFLVSIPTQIAFADDSDGALADGGSIVTSTDGGREAVAPFLGWSVAWTASVRCEGQQSTRYVMCTSSTCAATANSQLLDYDVTQDIPVNRSGPTKTYVALRTDDGGIPLCQFHVNR